MDAANGAPDGKTSHSRSIGELLGASIQAAEAAGIDRRHLRVGIWRAVMTVVIEASESPEMLVEVLEDRIATVSGFGNNPDSPLQVLTPEEDAALRDGSAAYADIVLGYVNPMLDHLDERGEDGITPFLDIVLQHLAESWGPHHLRRILADQVQALRDGVMVPIMPVQPAQFNRSRAQQPRPRPAAPAAPAPEPHRPPEEPATVSPARPARPVPDRVVSVHVLADVASDGSGVYGLAMSVTCPGQDRTEVREIAGRIDAGGNPRATCLTACAEALASLGEPSPDEPVTIVTGPHFIAPEADVPARVPAEEAARQRLFALAEGRVLTWVAGKGGIGSDLAERADRLLRLRLEEAGKLRIA